jgi:hypothetical protein
MQFGIMELPRIFSAVSILLKGFQTWLFGSGHKLHGCVKVESESIKKMPQRQKNEHFGKLLHAKVPTRRITHTRTDAA